MSLFDSKLSLRVVKEISKPHVSYVKSKGSEKDGKDVGWGDESESEQNVDVTDDYEGSERGDWGRPEVWGVACGGIYDLRLSLDCVEWDEEDRSWVENSLELHFEEHLWIERLSELSFVVELG